MHYEWPIFSLGEQIVYNMWNKFTHPGSYEKTIFDYIIIENEQVEYMLLIYETNSTDYTNNFKLLIFNQTFNYEKKEESVNS